MALLGELFAETAGHLRELLAVAQASMRRINWGLDMGCDKTCLTKSADARRSCLRRSAVQLACLLMVGQGSWLPLQAADSIFDDDWGSKHSPPPQVPASVPSKPEQPTPATKPASEPDAPLHWGGVELPPEAPAAPAPPAVAMPDPSALVQGVALLRELYARDYADASERGKRSLAARLLALGVVTRNDEAGRCARLLEAQRLAMDAGDPTLAFQAIDQRADLYHLDALDAKTEALHAAAGSATPPKTARLLTAALELLRPHQKASDRAPLARLVDVAERLAPSCGDIGLRLRAQAELQRVRQSIAIEAVSAPTSRPLAPSSTSLP